MWDEELLIDEVTHGDVMTESMNGFLEGKRRSEVVGGTNVGIIKFQNEEVIQNVLWKIVFLGKETEHRATFDIVTAGLS